MPTDTLANPRVVITDYGNSFPTYLAIDRGLNYWGLASWSSLHMATLIKGCRHHPNNNRFIYPTNKGNLRQKYNFPSDQKWTNRKSNRRKSNGRKSNSGK